MFTGDDVKRYEDNPYLFEIVNPGDRQKTDAIRKYYDNKQAIDWLANGFHDKVPHKGHDYYFGLKIAEALEWYAKYKEHNADGDSAELKLPQQEAKTSWLRRNNSTESGVEIVDIEPEDTTDWKKIDCEVKSDAQLTAAEIAKIIRMNKTTRIQKILKDQQDYDIAFDALFFWNRLMPTLVTHDGVEKRKLEDAPKQDQILETVAPAADQKPTKDTPILEAVRNWKPGATRPKIFFIEIDKIKKKLEVGTKQAVINFCNKYGFSGQENAFEKSYEGYCRGLVKKKGTIEPRLTHNRTMIEPRF